MNKSYKDITFIGNAIVDIIVKTSDELLMELKIPKGGMQLVDSETADKLINNASSSSFNFMQSSFSESEGISAHTPLYSQ